MSNLVDFQIRNLCREVGLVEPYESELINPASIDVTLGNVIQAEGRICGPEALRTRWIRHELKDDDEFILTPGAFILAHTREFVRIPNNLEANFQLKSSRGREGLNHLLAGYIDPGFHGQITLELENVNQRHNIILKPGMRIGQLRFGQLREIPMRGYAVTGRYMGDLGAVPSKG
jgi:dCTP deaminase